MSILEKNGYIGNGMILNDRLLFDLTICLSHANYTWDELGKRVYAKDSLDNEVPAITEIQYLNLTKELKKFFQKSKIFVEGVDDQLDYTKAKK